MLLAIAFVVSLGAVAFAGPAPANLAEVECAMHGVALKLAQRNTPHADLTALSDALRLQLCNTTQQRLDSVHSASRRVIPSTTTGPAATDTVYVDAVHGSDSNDGSAKAPVQSLPRAQVLARAARANPNPNPNPNPSPKGTGGSVVVVQLADGTYRLNATLQLDARDSGCSYQAAPGARPIISGALAVPVASFAPVAGRSGLLAATVALPPDGAHPAAAAPIVPCAIGTDSGSDNCALEQNVDFNGNDIQITTATSPAECCSKCAALTGCKFFTSQHAGTGPCYLKSSDAGRRPYSKHISGQPGGGPPPPPPPPPPPFSFGPSPSRVNTLFVNGRRQVRARYPNGNPQDSTGICFSKLQYPDEACRGYLQAEGSYGPSLPSPPATATVSSSLNRGQSPTKGCPQCTTYGTFKHSIYPPPEGHPVYNKPLPGIGWSNTSTFSFWASLFSRPGGFVHKELAARAAANWSSPSDGIVHMFHGGLWGGWQYQMNGFEVKDSAFTFGYGGYQEARGYELWPLRYKGGCSSISSNSFYVENIFEELDTPGEWWYNRTDDTLFFMPNGTFGSDTVVALPLLDTLIAINGTTATPALDISLIGLEFTETRSTFLQQYEVPSGGDWSIHRGAAVHVENAERVAIEQCSFNQTGGNALLFSNHVENATAAYNSFVYIGDSAIVLLGSTNGMDGTQPTYPFNTRIANNFIHEIGVYGKQTSCIAHSLAANSTIIDNVCFNGPRAGINFNDGFFGRNWLENNLVFNMVRETGDHGPYNSWDRQPYLTKNGIDDGFTPQQRPAGTSIIKAADIITRNFVINGYNGVWTFDHDDGSQFMNDTANVMLFGGCKNYLGNSKSCDTNFILFPGIDERATGNRKCQTDDNGVYANQVFHNNTCVTSDGIAYSWGSCSPPLAEHTYATYGNMFSAPGGNFSCVTTSCGSTSYATLKAWQAAGADRGSAVEDIMSVDAMVARAEAMLGL